MWDGDATDLQLMNAVCERQDVVVSGAPANPRIAHTLGTAAKEQGVRRVVWVAGASNMPGPDGETPLMPDSQFYKYICLSQRYT